MTTDLEETLRTIAKETFDVYGLPFVAYCNEMKAGGTPDYRVLGIAAQLIVNIALNVSMTDDEIDLENARRFLQMAANMVAVARPEVHEASDGRTH